MVKERKKREAYTIALKEIKDNVQGANYDEETKKILLDFSTRFNEILTEKEKSNVEFAKDIEINDTTVGNYRKGKRLPEISILVKIADALSVPVDYLLGKTNVKDLSKDDYNKKFGFNDETIDNLSSIKNKEINNIIFNNDNIIIDYLYEQIKLYVGNVKLLEDYKNAIEDVDTEYDAKYFELFDNVENSKIKMYNALVHLIDVNTK